MIRRHLLDATVAALLLVHGGGAAAQAAAIAATQAAAPQAAAPAASAPAAASAQEPPAAPPVPAPGAKPINAKCPVLTDEDAETKYSVSWRGVNIGLCCAKCQKKFIAHPEAYLANLPPLPAAPPPLAENKALTSPAAAAAAPAPADGDAHGDADNDADADADAGGVLDLFGRFHVLIVHFPIALLLAAALAELLSLVRRSAGLSAAAHFCVNFAAVAAPITALSGLQLASDYKAEHGLEQTLEWHRYGGIATAGLAVIIALLGWRARRAGASPGVSSGAAQAFRVLLFATAVLVAITSHFGGELVHGAGYPFE